MSYKNAIKQVAAKPARLGRMLKFNTSKKRKFGKNIKPCRRCGKRRGIIVKYGIQYCRQCFREEAERLGFRKYN